MSDTTTPKKRGRPSTGTAKTSTERSRLMRERVEQLFNVAFHPGRPLEPFADSALLLAFEQSYRNRWPAYTEAFGRELFIRAGVSVEATQKATADVGLKWDGTAWSPVTTAGPIGVGSTKTDTVAATETPPLDLEPSAPPPKPKGYPDWLKARAVAMHRAGEGRETIRAMLIEQHGKAPDVTNWSKTMRRWEEIQHS
ncbi:MAG: hypothetical protein MZV65_25930 [Chromatiales bacterium]|nr:hypothetical protein [Chromatiales bacterium]